MASDALGVAFQMNVLKWVDILRHQFLFNNEASLLVIPTLPTKLTEMKHWGSLGLFV